MADPLSKPWMGGPEIEEIIPLITDARVFEYGSGGSTIFFGNKAKEYYSLETNKSFYKGVKGGLLSLDHVKIFYETDHKKYLNKINEIGGQFDVVLVDNDEIPRVKCALYAFDHIKDDGFLLVHDSTFTNLLEENAKTKNRQEKLQKLISEFGRDKEEAAWNMLKSELHPLIRKYTLHKTIQGLSLFKKDKKSKILPKWDAR